MTIPNDVTRSLVGAVPDVAPSVLARLINHELRTPLAVLVGHLELLSDRAGELPADMRWSVHALERAAHRLSGAVSMTCHLVETNDHDNH